MSGQRGFSKFLAYSIILGLISFVLLLKFGLLPGLGLITDNAPGEENNSQEIKLPNNSKSIEKLKQSLSKNPYLEGSMSGKADCSEDNEYFGSNYDNSYIKSDEELYDNGYDSGYFSSGCEY